MKIVRHSLPALLLLASALPAAPAACPGCDWSERGDRSEGVKTKSLMISGGSFELLSVAYGGDRGALGSGSRLELAFWMPAAAELDELRVWAPLPSAAEREKVSYVMEPARRDYPAGRAGFGWPADEVVAPLGLPLDSLHVLIRAEDTYLPGRLRAGGGEGVDGYRFVFESSAGIDADCDVVRGGDGALVRRMECYEEYGGTIAVTWDGRDEAGRPVAEGDYVLRIDGDMLAETIRPLEASVPFRHRPTLE